MAGARRTCGALQNTPNLHISVLGQVFETRAAVTLGCRSKFVRKNMAMAVPKVPRSIKSKDLSDGAPAFWQVATRYGNGVLGQRFGGDLDQFGFSEGLDESDRPKLREALSVSLDIIPMLATRADFDPEKSRALENAQFDRWLDASDSRFWRHPDEKTFAVSIPYSFVHPYGLATLVLVSFEWVGDPKDQIKRNKRLGGLNVANQSKLENPSAAPSDAYISKGGVFAGTFAFSKQRCVGGRDRCTTSARGFSLSKGETEYKYTSSNTPSLYLEMTSEEISV